MHAIRLGCTACHVRGTVGSIKVTVVLLKCVVCVWFTDTTCSRGVWRLRHARLCYVVVLNNSLKKQKGLCMMLLWLCAGPSRTTPLLQVYFCCTYCISCCQGRTMLLSGSQVSCHCRWNSQERCIAYFRPEVDIISRLHVAGKVCILQMFACSSCILDKKK